MTVTEQILNQIHDLPESVQSEVLDFIEYLKSKLDAQERTEWSHASLSFALRDMESEETDYTEDDVKEAIE